MKITKIENVGKKPVYDLSVAEVEHYVLENGVVTHNTGIYYSASDIWIIGRQQDKDGNELLGYNFIINIEKSRSVKEKSKIPISVTFEGGVQKYSGLLDLAVEGGFVHKGKKSRSTGYFHIDQETGEVDESVSFYEEETNTPEFWNRYLNNEKFQTFVKEKYSL